MSLETQESFACPDDGAPIRGVAFCVIAGLATYLVLAFIGLSVWGAL